MDGRDGRIVVAGSRGKSASFWGISFEVYTLERPIASLDEANKLLIAFHSGPGSYSPTKIISVNGADGGGDDAAHDQKNLDMEFSFSAPMTE